MSALCSTDTRQRSVPIARRAERGCRIHGGKRTEQRTAEGRGRMGWTTTKHGSYSVNTPRLIHAIWVLQCDARRALDDT